MAVLSLRISSSQHDVLGDEREPGLLLDLRNAATNALLVFEDIFDATICAQAGVYRGVEDPENPCGFLLSGGVELNIKDAENKLALCVVGLQRAKASLAAELGKIDRR